MEKNISDQELLSMFQKIQKLEPQQLNTVKDFISAYLLKADLQSTSLAASNNIAAAGAAAIFKSIIWSS